MRIAVILLLIAGWCGPLFVYAQETAPAPGSDTPAAASTPASEQATGADAATAENPDAATEGDQAPPTSLELFVKKLKTTGKTGIFLMLLSVLGLAFILERVFCLRRNSIVPTGLAAQADRLWKTGDLAKLSQICQQSNSTLGRVIAAIVRHRQAGPSEVSTIAGDIASRELRRQQQKAYPIAVIATLAPLLGLLGTMIGMIGAFATVAAVGSMGDPSVLADDISKALLTTAWGLILAIPALAAYHFFKSRTNGLAMELEEQASTLISHWLHTSAPVTTAAPPEQSPAKPKSPEVSHAG
jgi:biopolymer transport protein ExbB